MTGERAQELLLKLVDGDADAAFGFVQANIIDSIIPCICSNGDCGYTSELEPDSREGYCENCESHSMISCTELMIAGALDEMIFSDEKGETVQ